MKTKSLTQAHHSVNPNYNEPKTERNLELYKDHKAGVQVFDSCAKYRITSTRYYQIVNRMRKLEEEA